MCVSKRVADASARPLPPPPPPPLCCTRCREFLFYRELHTQAMIIWLASVVADVCPSNSTIAALPTTQFATTMRRVLGYKLATSR